MPAALSPAISPPNSSLVLHAAKSRLLGVLRAVPLLAMTLTGCSGVDSLEPSEEIAVGTGQLPLTGPIRYVRIHALLAADDDGGRAAGISPDAIAKGVASANQTYAPQSVQFIFDPQTDFTRTNDSWVNRDCIPAAGADLSAQVKPACAWTRYHQRDVADSFAGKLLWIYVATWDGGIRNQLFLFGAAFTTLSTRIGQEQAGGYHVAQMQAYLENNGPRYDATFEPGSADQTAAIRWSLLDFVDGDARETAAGRRLVQFQGYDVGDGTLRYDGVWEASSLESLHTFSETAKPFGDLFDQKVSQGYHIVKMSSYYGRE